MAPKNRHITGRRHVSVLGQPVRVAECRVAHAHGGRCAVHAGRKCGFGPRNSFANGGGGIIGGFDGRRTEQITQLDRLPTAQA